MAMCTPASGRCACVLGAVCAPECHWCKHVNKPGGLQVPPHKASSLAAIEPAEVVLGECLGDGASGDVYAGVWQVWVRAECRCMLRSASCASASIKQTHSQPSFTAMESADVALGQCLDGASGDVYAGLWQVCARRVQVLGVQ